MQRKFNRKQNKYWIYVQTFIPEPFRLKVSKGNVIVTDFIKLFITWQWCCESANLATLGPGLHISEYCRTEPATGPRCIKRVSMRPPGSQILSNFAHLSAITRRQSEEKNAKCKQRKMFLYTLLLRVNFKGLRPISVN